MRLINKIKEILDEKRNISSFILGSVLNFAFAPFFIFPVLIVLSLFLYQIIKSEDQKDAFKIGWFFGFGFYIFNLYWIGIGVSVYIEQFWWAIPFAVILLPAFLGIYTALVSYLTFKFKDRGFVLLLFAANWIICEFLRSYLFTGFPWNLIAYSFSFSEIIIQTSSILGSYGLGTVIVLSFAGFYYVIFGDKKERTIFLISAGLIWIIMFYYGIDRLDKNPTSFSNIKLRLVQPSIEQSEKWTLESFWINFNKHKDLSLANVDKFSPDLIIWSESAVTVQPYYVQILNSLKNITKLSKAILITGGISDNYSNPHRSKDKLFASIYAIDQEGKILFDYHKSHLVPFGEYVPLSELLPIKKLTPGAVPFSPGMPGFIVNLEKLNLKIRPLLCYEIIFPDEVRTNNKEADLILNLTNDAYFGDNTGPYHHFYTSRMRAVENGLPLVRVANNGISSIIDPMGRIIVKTGLNKVLYVDAFLPSKATNNTIFSKNSNLMVYLFIIFTYILIQIPRISLIGKHKS